MILAIMNLQCVFVLASGVVGKPFRVPQTELEQSLEKQAKITEMNKNLKTMQDLAEQVKQLIAGH